MKRRVLCFFTLVFWTLALCTILAEKIEEQMTAVVIMKKQENGHAGELMLPMAALFSEDGQDCVYTVVKGENWNSGNRVQRVAEYRMLNGEIVVQFSSSCILYASKQIKEGDRAMIRTQYAAKAQEYLVVGEKPELVVRDGLLPYMERQVKEELALSETSRVYSLSEVRTFFKNMPWLGALAALPVMLLMLWAYSCRLSREFRENRFCLAANAGLGVMLTVIFSWVTKKLALPSSLLPPENIFDFGHYEAEFVELLGALGEASKSTWLGLQREVWLYGLLAAGVFLAGIAWILAVLVLERKIQYFNNKSGKT